MTTHLLTKRMLCGLPILFAASLVSVPAQSADLPPAKGSAEAGATTEPGMAAGAVEDTLQACMARIPKDASIGQRMIAEQGCGRDESDRKPFEAVPEVRSIRHQQS